MSNPFKIGDLVRFDPIHSGMNSVELKKVFRVVTECEDGQYELLQIEDLSSPYRRREYFHWRFRRAQKKNKDR